MMTRCAKCEQPIEVEDLVEAENPDDPLTPLNYHFFCSPDYTGELEEAS